MKNQKKKKHTHTLSKDLLKTPVKHDWCLLGRRHTRPVALYDGTPRGAELSPLTRPRPPCQERDFKSRFQRLRNNCCMWLISRRLNELLLRVTLWDLTRRSKGVEGFSSQRLDSAKRGGRGGREQIHSWTGISRDFERKTRHKVMWIFGCPPPPPLFWPTSSRSKTNHCVSTKQSDSTVGKLVRSVCCLLSNVFIAACERGCIR